MRLPTPGKQTLRRCRRQASAILFIPVGPLCHHKVGNVGEKRLKCLSVFFVRKNGLPVVLIPREDLLAEVSVPLARADYEDEGPNQVTVAGLGLGDLPEDPVGRCQVVQHGHQQRVLGAVLEAEARHELICLRIVIDGGSEIVLRSVLAEYIHGMVFRKHAALREPEVPGPGRHALVFVTQGNVVDANHRVKDGFSQ